MFFSKVESFRALIEALSKKDDCNIGLSQGNATIERSDDECVGQRNDEDDCVMTSEEHLNVFKSPNDIRVTLDGTEGAEESDILALKSSGTHWIRMRESEINLYKNTHKKTGERVSS